MNQFLNNVLKWAIQIMEMLGDILLIGAAITVLISAYIAKSLFLFIGSIVLVCLVYHGWKSQGRFIAWTNRKQFMSNWDKMTKHKRVE